MVRTETPLGGIATSEKEQAVPETACTRITDDDPSGCDGAVEFQPVP
jgi:hypothetical protein